MTKAIFTKLTVEELEAGKWYRVLDEEVLIFPFPNETATALASMDPGDIFMIVSLGAWYNDMWEGIRTRWFHVSHKDLFGYIALEAQDSSPRFGNVEAEECTR